MNDYYVYMLASQRNGTIYTGITSDLVRRIGEHKEGLVKGFTKQHNVKMLVWYEVHSDVNEAILREKRLKCWNREWKLELIEKDNPDWKDLYEDICK
jgi:putative endonuclease